MKQKVAIVNDRKVPMRLQIQNIEESPGTTTHTSEFKTIEIGQGAVVEIEMPEGHIPYFKVWETGVAFLSSMRSDIDLNGG